MIKPDYIFEKTEECEQHAASELEMTEYNGGLCEASQAHVVQSQEIMDEPYEFIVITPDYEKPQPDIIEKIVIFCWEFFFGRRVPESKEKLTKLSEGSDKAKLSEGSDEAKLSEGSDEAKLSEGSDEAKLSEESDEAKLSERSDKATQNLRLAEEEAKGGSYFDENFATSTGLTDVPLIGPSPVPIPSLRVDAPFLSVPDLYSNGNNAHSASWGTTNSSSTSLCSTPSLGSSPTPSLSDPEDYATIDITSAAVANTLLDAELAKFEPRSLRKPSPVKRVNIVTNINVHDLKIAKYFDKKGSYREAWRIFKRLADEGSPEAKFYTGYYLTHYHHGINMNVKEGLTLLYEAARHNQLDAQYWFGRAIIEGKAQAFLPKKFGKLFMKDGLEYLKKAAEQNHSLSIRYLEEHEKKSGCAVNIDQKKDRTEAHHPSGHRRASDFTGMEKPQPFCDPGLTLLRIQARNKYFRSHSDF